MYCYVAQDAFEHVEEHLVSFVAWLGMTVLSQENNRYAGTLADVVEEYDTILINVPCRVTEATVEHAMGSGVLMPRNVSGEDILYWTSVVASIPESRIVSGEERAGKRGIG